MGQCYIVQFRVSTSPKLRHDDRRHLERKIKPNADGQLLCESHISLWCLKILFVIAIIVNLHTISVSLYLKLLLLDRSSFE